MHVVKTLRLLATRAGQGTVRWGRVGWGLFCIHVCVYNIQPPFKLFLKVRRVYNFKMSKGYKTIKYQIIYHFQPQKSRKHMPIIHLLHSFNKLPPILELLQAAAQQFKIIVLNYN